MRIGKKSVKCFARDERGTTFTEYGLIIAVVFLAMMSAISGFADEAQQMFTHIATKTDEAVSNSP